MKSITTPMIPERTFGIPVVLSLNVTLQPSDFLVSATTGLKCPTGEVHPDSIATIQVDKKAVTEMAANNKSVALVLANLVPAILAIQETLAS